MTQERITGIHAQIASLEKQLEAHRNEITALEADLKETTEVKERLESAEASAEVPETLDAVATVRMVAQDKPDAYVRT